MKHIIDCINESIFDDQDMSDAIVQVEGIKRVLSTFGVSNIDCDVDKTGLVLSGGDVWLNNNIMKRLKGLLTGIDAIRVDQSWIGLNGVKNLNTYFKTIDADWIRMDNCTGVDGCKLITSSSFTMNGTSASNTDFHFRTPVSKSMMWEALKFEGGGAHKNLVLDNIKTNHSVIKISRYKTYTLSCKSPRLEFVNIVQGTPGTDFMPASQICSIINKGFWEKGLNREEYNTYLYSAGDQEEFENIDPLKDLNIEAPNVSLIELQLNLKKFLIYVYMFGLSPGKKTASIYKKFNSSVGKTFNMANGWTIGWSMGYLTN